MSYSTGFSTLLGRILTAVDINDDRDVLTFTCDDGSRFWMGHHQDCCETVSVEEIVGDLPDLIGSPILLAEEVSSTELPEGVQPPEYRDESETWTFYKLSTIKGSVAIRWYGSSNGYYSEEVSFEAIQ